MVLTDKKEKVIKEYNISLFDLLRLTATKHPKHTAIIFQGKKISFQDLDTQSDKFAMALIRIGVKKADCVALFLPNIPQYIIGYFGALKAGAFVTTINPISKSGEIESQLINSEAKVILCLDLFLPLINEAIAKTKIEKIIATNVKEYMPKTRIVAGTLARQLSTSKIKDAGIIQFKKLVEEQPNRSPIVSIKPIEDLAVLQFTGGTTGIPKGVMLSHYNLVANAIMCAKWLGQPEKKNTVLSVLPLSHIYGMTTCMNSPIFLAYTMVLMPRFGLEALMHSIQKYHVSILCGIPYLYSEMLNYLKFKKCNLYSLKFAISGGAPLDPKIQKAFIQQTGSLLVEGYGLTEASPVTHANPLDPTMKTVKVGSIGLPWADTDALIVDINSGQKLGTGQIGEILIKGPQIMKGYWKMPLETEKVLKHGWLHTGDLGRIDRDGYFYIVGRKKNLIKYKGYSIYPHELEYEICQHNAVAQCCVVGKLEEPVGEVPKAFVVLKEGAQASEQEIIEFVNSKMSDYKAIRDVEFRKKLPIDAKGVVSRSDL